MLKKYKITVDGKAYEVEVEDVGSSTSAQSVSAPISTPVAAAQAAPVEVKPSAQAPVAAAAPKAPAAEPKGEVLRAPMPGTILSVTASVGKTVKRGDILLVLEAMKMENEILAPRDAKIVAVNVAKGSTVNSGDVLLVLA